MAKYAVLDAFYNSDDWKSFRLALIIRRSIKNGGVICEHCGKPIADAENITAHHVIELTPENVNNYKISMNPDNIKLIHGHPCHDEIHKRFGYGKGAKRVYVVWGPPLSGKASFVRENMQRGDLVVDMDRLYEAVSMLPYYDKPNELLTNVRGLYSLLIDNIKTRHGKWRTAWVIGGLAQHYERDRLIADLGAEDIRCHASKEECLARLANDADRRMRQDEWRGYIDKWFDRFTESPYPNTPPIESPRSQSPPSQN